MAKPILIFLVIAASCIIAKGAKKDKCDCKTFSFGQEQKLREILQSEAGSLQTGLQQMFGLQRPVRWMQIQNPVCFSARDDKYGTVSVKHEGFVAAIKLLLINGYLTCNTSSDVHKSNWGCGTSKPSHDQALINTYITCDHNDVLFPSDSIIKDRIAGWYRVPEAQHNSRELVLSRFTNPVYVRKDQQLRVWYGEDLFNHGEANNGGRLCAHLFMWYN